MSGASPFPCVRCGQFPIPAEVNRIVKQWTPSSATTIPLLSNRSTTGLEYCPLTDLCLDCLLRDELAQARLVLDRVDPAAQRKAIWSAQCVPGGEIDAAWCDFSLLVFGRQIGVVAVRPDNDPFDTRTVPWAAHYRLSSPLVFVTQSWLRRVRYRDTPLYLEERWNPTMPEPKVTLHGLQHDVPASEANEASRRGRKILQVLSQRGRPSGGRFSSPEECKNHVVSYLESIMEDGRAIDRRDSKVTQRDAELFLLGVESGGRQLRRELGPYRWSDILDDVRKANP